MNESYIFLEITGIVKIVQALYFPSDGPRRGEQGHPEFWDVALGSHRSTENLGLS